MSGCTFDNFFGLLRFSLGTSASCPRMCLRDWRDALEMARKQAVSAFIGSSLISVNGDVLIEEDEKSRGAFSVLVMEWTGDVVRTTRRNQKLNEDVVAELARLEANGLQCCLLKGQGNALMYPNPNARTPGDIDVWVRPKDAANTDADIQKIIRMAKDALPNSKASYHHVDIPDINGTPVEVHYRPQFLFSYCHNKHLQDYFNKHAYVQFNNKVKLGKAEIAVPTPDFNIVFQLSHIYNHLFHEGIGLRQLIDYYYQLKAFSHPTPEERGNGKLRKDYAKLLHQVGLYHIAGAIIWILADRFGMPAEWSIVEPDEKRGKFVLNEIMQGGNFGKSDKRYHFSNTAIGKNLQRLQRDCRLFRYFPSEALSEPVFRLWHAWWRYRHN